MIGNPKITSSARWLFVFLPLCLFMTSSCLKDPTLEDNPGTEVSSGAVQAAMIKAWDLKKDIYVEMVDDIKMNETVTFQNAYVIHGVDQDTTINKNRRTTEFIRASLDDQKKNLLMNFKISLEPTPNSSIATKPENWESPPFSIPLSEDSTATASTANTALVQSKLQTVIAGAKSPIQALSDVDPEKSEAELLSIHDLVYYAVVACTLPDTKCYDLRTTSELINAPDVFSKQPNCGGLTDCKLKVNTVQYTISTSYVSNGVKKKLRATYKIKIAPQMPYLSRIVQKCSFQMFVINNQALAADYCQSVVDSKLGTDWYSPATQ